MVSNRTTLSSHIYFFSQCRGDTCVSEYRCARCTHRVQEQHALVGPRGQVPVPDEGAADVVPELLEDVEQAGG